MRLVSVFLLVLLASACARKDAPVAAPAKAPASAASGTSAAHPFAAVSGVVEERLDATDYTYMRLKTADGEVWAAITKSAVKKGEQVTVVNAMPMDGFESKTLNRKFDRIVFGTLDEPGAAALTANPNVSAPADTGKIDVKKAEGPDGTTVAEIFSAKGALKGKDVAVRGKVVKYTPGVMGKNWIHLRDGSGSREQKNDDITVTTADTTALGEVVLVRGTVRLDVDLGAGYAYPVLIENAKLSK
jgi:hypothetical protein